MSIILDMSKPLFATCADLRCTFHSQYSVCLQKEEGEEEEGEEEEEEPKEEEPKEEEEEKKPKEEL